MSGVAILVAVVLSGWLVCPSWSIRTSIPLLADVINAECVSLTWKCPNDAISFWLSNKKIGKLAYELKLGEDNSLKSAPFVNAKKLVILIHGYWGDKLYAPNTELIKAYLDSGDYNIVTVDWSEGAKAPCYAHSAKNVQLVGQCTAELLVKLYKYRSQVVGVDKTHVIGFSLGAHVAGFVGKILQSTFRRTIPRITGLDPALPLFDSLTKGDAKSIDKADGGFVDIIHTNAGGKGRINPMGHVDFYVNNGGSQPGCKDATCNHQRAVDLFAESINSPKGLWAARCLVNKLFYVVKIKSEACTPVRNNDEPLALMGEHVDWRSKGAYMLRTNTNSPYAKGKVAP